MNSEQLKDIRIQKKLTQVEMAKKIGVPPVTYIAWEQGKSTPNFENKLKIKEFLKG